MSNETRQTELREKTQQLLQGPLKHIRAAALAAALLPLASVAAAPASAQGVCPTSGGVAACGYVFTDTNNNGILDAGEPVIEGIQVIVCQLCDGSDNIMITTDTTGFYYLFLPAGGTYTAAVLIPTGTQASPLAIGGNAGIPNGTGYSVAAGGTGLFTDFGFFTPPSQQPGTGTPGYWKNHPEAWPVNSITVGSVTYTKAQAIAWLTKVGKDKTTTMFSSLVPAMLNVIIGNDGSCVSSTIAAANTWMATYGPVGSNVAASSYAWTVGEPLHIQMDSYNNGLLCAPHRQ
jgi:hypothetical protein